MIKGKYYYLRDDIFYEGRTGTLHRIKVFVIEVIDHISCKVIFSNMHGDNGGVLEMLTSKYDLKEIK